VIDSNYQYGLQQCFLGIIFYTQSVLTRTDASLESVVRELDKKFQRSVKIALSVGIDIRDYDNARFAICAWLDELLMSRKWSFRESWRECLFQYKFYQTTRAGTEYFDRLTKLDKNDISVREIYILCLVFGFTGRYSKHGDVEKLNRLRKDELRKLTASPINDTNCNARSVEASDASVFESNLFDISPIHKLFKHKYRLWYFAFVAYVSAYTIYSIVLSYHLTNAIGFDR